MWAEPRRIECNGRRQRGEEEGGYGSGQSVATVRLTAKLYAQGQPVRQKGDINSIAASFISSVHKARIMWQYTALALRRLAWLCVYEPSRMSSICQFQSQEHFNISTDSVSKFSYDEILRILLDQHSTNIQLSNENGAKCDGERLILMASYTRRSINFCNDRHSKPHKYLETWNHTHIKQHYHKAHLWAISLFFKVFILWSQVTESVHTRKKAKYM